jgi:hypothetical protein
MYSSNANRRCGRVFCVTNHPTQSGLWYYGLSNRAGVINILRLLSYKNWYD